jgi:hypothetical protein
VIEKSSVVRADVTRCGIRQGLSGEGDTAKRFWWQRHGAIALRWPYYRLARSQG